MLFFSGLIKQRRGFVVQCFRAFLQVHFFNFITTRRIFQQPSAGSKSKVLCCWCCASAPIEGKVNADKTGYVPGEFVRANGSIDNRRYDCYCLHVPFIVKVK